MPVSRLIQKSLVLWLFWVASSVVAEQPQSLNSDFARYPELPKVTGLAHPHPMQILFVGNSYLYYNDSLHNHVRRLAEEQNPGNQGKYKYKSATIGGAALSHHYLDAHLESGRLGLDSPFDLVIMQGGSAEPLSEKRRRKFAQTAEEHHQKIEASGAETALYMTHAYVAPHRRAAPGLIEPIRQTYVQTGNQLGALVIPVGLAFERAYGLRPEMKLHESFDGTHPSMLGTYLAACVVYASIYRDSPVGFSYTYFGEVDSADAAFLQQVAWDTVVEFFGR